MQNAVLNRLRQGGVNWGNPPTQGNTSFNPPYEVALYLNEGYTNFLARTQNYSLAPLKVSFPTQSNVNSYSINPIPPNVGTINPAALRVYEFTYTPINAQERRIDFVSTTRFRSLTAQYIARLGAYSAWPRFVTQLFDRQQIDLWPGTATAGDKINLTICPNPQASPSSVSAANGGMFSSS